MIDGMGNHSAIFLLFNPNTNTHYLMFQCSDSASSSGHTALSLVMPSGSIVTESDESTELSLTTAD